MASTEIRNRRRILRYRGLVLRQAVQMSGSAESRNHQPRGTIAHDET
jgi:hypothetical protein